MKLLDPDKEYSLPEPKSEEEALLSDLHQASLNWYSTNYPEFIKQYHDAYYALRALGWNGAIDLDAELPDNLMPQDYFSQAAAAQQTATHRQSMTVKLTLESDTDNQEVLKVMRETLDKVGVKEVMLTKTSA